MAHVEPLPYIGPNHVISHSLVPFAWEDSYYDDASGPFVGRGQTMQAVRQLLTQDDARVAVLGNRGQGKTRFAQELSREVEKSGWTWEGYHVHRYPGPVFFEDLVPRLPPHTRLLIVDDIHRVGFEDVGALTEAMEKRPRLRLVVTGLTAETLQLFIDGSRRQPTTVPLGALSRRQISDLLREMGVDPSVAGPLAKYGDHDGHLASVLDLVRRGHLVGSALRVPTILGPDGRPLDRDSAGFQAVELSVKDTSDALIAYFAKHPKAMYEMDPRAFEELVAELYDREGFEVELTRASKDGGVDIYAVQRAPFGTFLTVVDCKRYAPDNPIEVSLVRGMYGTVNDLDASMGVIATTSYFTHGAKQLQERRKHRLGLQDFMAVQDMLRRAREM